MATSTKKGGGTLGINPKPEKNDASSGPASTLSKGDSLSTTPSKSSKHGISKKANTGTGMNSKSDSSANSAILTQHSLEALYSATYVEDFIDCNDNMSDDLIRQTTRMFEMGSNYMTYIRELESAMAVLLGEDDEPLVHDQLTPEKRKAVFRLQQVLMTAQDTGDESLQVMQGIQDHIENKTRQLDVDRKNLAEFCKEQDLLESAFKDPPPPPTERNIKRARRQRHEIYRPSILGPSSLKATSYPETVSNSRDSEAHVVTSGRSRERERDRRERESGDRESHKESSKDASGSAASGASSSDDGPSTTSKEQQQEQSTSSSRPNGRTSERSGGGSSRTSNVTSSSVDKESSGNEKSERGSSNHNSLGSSSSKKQSHKNQTQEKKTKKRKAKQNSSNSRDDDNSPQQYAIDPDEPTYCLCDQVSYGEMIGCDNDLCPIEWFHFSCVSLTTKPKGKWYCPKCRGDRPNVMKPKAIFLKELEKYNREKEEKA